MRPTPMCLPMGLSWPKKYFAADSLMMATFGAPPLSAAVKSRPCRTGMPTVEKNAGPGPIANQVHVFAVARMITLDTNSHARLVIGHHGDLRVRYSADAGCAFDAVHQPFVKSSARVLL